MSNGESLPLYRLPSVPEVRSFQYAPIDEDADNTISPPREPVDSILHPRATGSARSGVGIGPQVATFDYVPLDDHDGNTVGPSQERSEHHRAGSTGSFSTVSPPGSAREFRSSRPPSYGSETSLLRGLGVDNFHKQPTFSFQQPTPMSATPMNGIVRQWATLCEDTQKEDMYKKWGSKPNFNAPLAMILLWTCGLGSAIGHHVYYSLHHDTPAVDQIKHVRIGTFLAFLAKACFVGASVIGFKQRVWYTVRRKSMKLCGLDALFGVVEDPIAFVWPMDAAREMLSKAKLASFMALVIWLIPVASIVTPATLTTHLEEVIYPPQNCTVRVLNFTREIDADWQKPRNGRVGYNAAFYHKIENSSITGKPLEWYLGPSPQLTRVVEASLFGDTSVQKGQPTPCKNYTCTYNVSFEAPWYGCKEIESHYDYEKYMFHPSRFAGGPANYSNETKPDASRYPTDLIYKEYHQDDGYIGQNRSLYVPENNQATLERDQGRLDIWDEWAAIVFGIAENSTERDEEVPWPYHLENAKDLLEYDKYPTKQRFPFKIKSKVVRCSYQLAQYNVEHKWNNSDVAIRTVSVDPKTTRYLVEGNDPVIDVTDLYPEHPKYRLYVSYHAIAHAVMKVVSGMVQKPHYYHAARTESRVTMTKLFTPEGDNPDWPHPDMDEQFQKTFESVIVAILANPYFEVSQNEKVKCKRSRHENRFHYSPETLLVPYGAAVLLSLLWLIIGAVCIRRNGMVANSAFSTIMSTTRDDSLDVMVRAFPGASLGATPMPPDLRDTKLRFGIMRGEVDGARFECGMPHAAFGMAEHQLEEPLGKDVLKMDSLVEEWRRNAGVRPLPPTGLGAQPPPLMSEKAFFG